MLTLPYQTTLCRGLYPEPSLERTLNAIRRADLDYPLPRVKTPAGNLLAGAVFITPRDEHQDVPSFTQFLNMGDAVNPKLVIDARPYMRWEPRSDTYRLTAENDYTFQCIRMALTLRLMDGDLRVFNRLGDVPAKIFVRWITVQLASSFNLPLDTQIAVSIICGYYYYGMVNGAESLASVDERHRLAPMISRATMAPLNTVLDYAERIGPMPDASALARELAEHAGTIRLNAIKYADVYKLLAASWGGHNGRENVGVAMEHLPTFIAMAYSALDERSYRKTVLARRAETAGRPNDLKAFTDLVSRHVAEHFE
jgi:hypothetical protein